MANTAGIIESWQKYDITVTREIPEEWSYQDGNNFGGIEGSDLVAQWRFEPGTGTFLNDSIGNNDLSIVTVGGQPDPVEDADCIEGEGSCFFETIEDLSPCYLRRLDGDLDSDFPFKNGNSDLDFSWLFWVKFDSLDIEDDGPWILVQKGSSSPYRSALLDVNDTTCNIEMYLSTDGTVFDTLLSHASTLVTGRWYHIAFTYDVDSAGVATYRIRIFDATAKAVVGTDVTGSTIQTHVAQQPFYAGGLATNGSLYGNIDDLQVWKRALTVEEIDQIRSGTFGT